MQNVVQIMDESTVLRSLARITHEILERNNGASDICILGIKNRGIEFANILCQNVKKFDGTTLICGELDVTMHRDDYSKEQKQQLATKSYIPFDIENKTVIIVDDVLYTGRTARAAIETVFSIARPKMVQLAVLVDRGHRELPIRPDYVGKNVPTSREERVLCKTNKIDNEVGVYICK